ncbi:unnamed protein product [Adineta ricciae]|uniref:Tetraspanin n=1 Tax=Adineta ricciae TaxID=249248 RepID=A0A813RQQ4_ADIRI|nr:unnamed protein product [Adineta ricciae]CAF1629015.1 unnamed protein product [Adineta ricciae]
MAQLSCGVQCTRSLLLVLNVGFILVGFSVMGVGIYLKVGNNFRAISEISAVSQALDGEAMQWVSIGMIVLGVFTALLAIFGCLGAMSKNRCFLYVYAICLTLIILVEFAAVIATLIYRNDLYKSFDSGFMEVFQHAYSKNQTEVQKAIESLEENFKCCGVNGPSDYSKFGFKMPRSCYRNKDDFPIPYSDGCALAVAVWIWNELPIIASVLGVILFIEIFGVISALVLGVAVSHSSSPIYYAKF